MIIEIIIFLVTSIIAYQVYIHRRILRNFDENGIKYITGVPLFGNVLASTFFIKHMLEDISAVYRAFPDEKYVGFVEGKIPIIFIRDPDLIKRITVKDFDHFVDHRQYYPEEVEPLFDESLFKMQGLKWRDMRTTLSPVFTASKMRQMVPFMLETSNNIIEYLKDHQSEDIDVEELMRRYTNDVIASACFGFQVNSLEDMDNEFYKTGQELFAVTGWHRLYYFIAIQFPDLAKKIVVPLFSGQPSQFFRTVVTTAIEYRIKNNVERPDMIQLLIEASKGTLKHSKDTAEKDNVGYASVEEVLKPRENARKWTQDELASQVMLFFVGGFETSAVTLVMCVHELALNPTVQEKVYQETKAFKESGRSLSYDSIGDLKYLDCVLNESMRKWPVGMVIDRVCTKTYEFPPPREGGKPYIVEPGQIIYCLVTPLHMDPQYFPDPEKFDPERFSDENKHKIKPFTFMPFGVGPRGCLGTRFALLALKTLIFDLVVNFKIVKCEKTMDPIRLNPLEFNIKAAKGTWVKLQARN